MVLYNSNLTNLHNMTGDQIGAYFGYSVASGDLNGDGLDDVIIGAPMWTNYEVMGKYETGKVFIVYQNQNVSKFGFLHWSSKNDVTFLGGRGFCDESIESLVICNNKGVLKIL